MSLNGILQKLNDTMGQIVTSAEHVSSRAKKMSTAAQALSQGSMAQTGAVEELEGTMRPVTQSVRQNAALQAREPFGGMGRRPAEGN